MKKIRILIVDDEPGIRESLSGVLEDEGYLCTALESAEKCLEELRRQTYEVLLLDVSFIVQNSLFSSSAERLLVAVRRITLQSSVGSGVDTLTQ